MHWLFLNKEKHRVTAYTAETLRRKENCLDRLCLEHVTKNKFWDKNLEYMYSSYSWDWYMKIKYYNIVSFAKRHNTQEMTVMHCNAISRPKMEHPY